MSTQYDQIFSQAHQLTPEEIYQLAQDLLTLYHHQIATNRQHDIMEFKGIAKKLWQGVDIEKYIDEERNSWNG